MSNIQNPIQGAEVFAGGVIGRIAKSADRELIIGCVPEGPTNQSTVISIGGAENSSEYSITLTSTARGVNISETVSYTTDSSTSQTELRDGLIAALLSNSLILGVVEYPVAGTNQITLTAKPGRAFTLAFPANPTTDLTQATTPAAAGPSYAFGSVVQLTGPLNASAADASVGAKRPEPVSGTSLELTITHAGSQTLTATILHTPAGGAVQGYDLSVATGGSAAATDTAVVDDLEAQYPSATVTNAVEGTVIITFPAGDTASAYGAAGSGSADLEIAATAGDAAPQVGIVLDTDTNAPVESRSGFTSVTGTAPGQGLSVLMPGDGSTMVCVPAQHASYVYGSPVYYGADASVSDEYTKLFNAAGTGRAILPRARWSHLDTADSSRVYATL